MKKNTTLKKSMLTLAISLGALAANAQSVAIQSDDADNSICNGTAVTFTATPTDGGSSPQYEWFVNGASVQGPDGSNMLTTSALNDGDDVTVTMTPGAGATNPDPVSGNSIEMDVISVMTPTVTVNAPAKICYLQGSAAFTSSFGNTDGVTTFQWTRNNKEVTGATSVTWACSDISKYTTEDIGLEVTNTVGNCSATGRNVATVKAFNTVDPNTLYTTTSGSSKLCEGDAVMFRAKSSAVSGATFQWRRDGNPIPGETNNTYTTDVPGQISLKTTSVNGCVRTSDPRVINPLPQAVTSIQGGAAPSFCTGSSVTLIANNVNGASYRWKLDGNDRGNNIIQEAKAPGNYTVTVTKNSCAATSAPIMITELTTNVTTNITAGAAEFCAGGSCTMSAANIPGYTYQWYRGSTLLTDQVNPDITVAQSGSYRVSVSNGGCPIKKSVATVVTTAALPAVHITAISQQPNFWILRGPAGSGMMYQWAKDGIDISGATSRDYQANQNGDYTLTIKKSVCSDVNVTPFTVTLTNPPTFAKYASNVETATAVNIYPNPSQGLFYISSQEPVNVTVRDMQGKIVASQTNAASIDMSAQAAGLYLMQLTNANGDVLHTERITKQ